MKKTKVFLFKFLYHSMKALEKYVFFLKIYNKFLKEIVGYKLKIS